MVSASGLPRLTRSSRSQAQSAAATTAATRLPRQTEDINRSTLDDPALEVARNPAETERRGRVAGVEIFRGHGARPAADPRRDRDILPAVGAAIADRLADDPAAGLEPPQQLAGTRVDRFEPAVHRAVE